MVTKPAVNFDDLEVVGRMGTAKVYLLDSGGPLWTEYQCRGNVYRATRNSDILMKRVARKIEHFDDIPLGGFNEIMKTATDDLTGVSVIMSPTASLTSDHQPRGGQLIVVGWTYDVTVQERDFFDGLNTK